MEVERHGARVEDGNVPTFPRKDALGSSEAANAIVEGAVLMCSLLDHARQAVTGRKGGPSKVLTSL